MVLDSSKSALVTGVYDIAKVKVVQVGKKQNIHFILGDARNMKSSLIHKVCVSNFYFS